MTIEEKLDALARCGLKLKDQFGVPDLVQSWGPESLDEPGWNLARVCLGMTEEKPPWTPHCDNLYYELGGQDCIIGCVTREQYAALQTLIPAVQPLT